MATDDVLHFRATGSSEYETITAPLARLDKVWGDMSVVINEEKSFDLEESGDALGVRLVEGKQFVRSLVPGGIS